MMKNIKYNIEKETGLFYSTIHYIFLGENKYKILFDEDINILKIKSEDYYRQKKREEKQIAKNHNRDIYEKINSLITDNGLNKISLKNINVNWNDEKHTKRIINSNYPKSIEYIQYNNKNYPETYLLVDGKTVKKSKPRTFFKLFKRIYKKEEEVNENRYKTWLNEKEKWTKEYNAFIEKLEKGYYDKEEQSIQLYYNLLIKNIDKNFDFKKESTVTYSIEEEKLEVNYTFLKDDKLMDILQGYYPQDNTYMKMYSSNTEQKEKLSQFLNLFIRFLTSKLFKEDKIGALKTIYLNTKITDLVHIKEGYSLNVIISKEKFNDLTELSHEAFSNFNRDLVLINRLREIGFPMNECNYDYPEINTYCYQDNKIEKIYILEENNLSSDFFKILLEFNDLKFLTIQNQNFNEIPIKIFELTQLNMLDLQFNSITNLSGNINKLANLRNFNISNNKIKKIPASILKLKVLKSLRINNNDIEEISLHILKGFLKKASFSLDIKNNNVVKDIDFKSSDTKNIIAKLISQIKKTKKKNKNSNSNSSPKIINIEEISEAFNSLPLIITEGKTDWKHLKKALERFQDRGEYLDLNLKFDEYEDRGSGEAYLKKQLDAFSSQINKKRIIGIFDRDTSKYVKDYGEKLFVKIIDKDYENRLKKKVETEYSDKSSPKYIAFEKNLEDGKYDKIDEELNAILTGKDFEEWKKLSRNNVYAFCIPEIEDSDSPRTLNDICIEFYYKEKDLKTTTKDGKRLFFADEFEFNKDNNKDASKRFISKNSQFKTSSMNVKNGATKELTLISAPVYSIDDEQCKNNLLLSKNDFTNNIINEVEGFNDFDIENFRLIFDVIEKIVND